MKKNKFKLLYFGCFLILSFFGRCTANKKAGEPKFNIQTKELTKQEGSDYFVGFFAESTSVLELQIGHAFIGIGRGIPLTCDLNGEETEMFGFYPKIHIEGGKSFWAGPVDGKIKNDIRTNINKYVFKKISFSDFVKVQLKMREWEIKKYEVTRIDCISFFQDVAKIFEDITIPDRTQYVTPEEYVSQFILINRQLK